MNARVVLGISGASGAVLGVAVARHLSELEVKTDLVASLAAERTLAEECGSQALPDLHGMVSQVHDHRDIGAEIASGSVPVAGMIVAPCSMRSLAAIANGLDDNLLTRAASVQLKERRPLVLMTREAPLTLAHLNNMTRVTEMGGIILPPVPAFYLKPASLDVLVSQIAARAVNLLRIAPQIGMAWSG